MMDVPIGTEKIPSTYKNAAAVCVFHKGLVCLGLRASKDLENKDYPYAGYWGVFGGAIEEKENAMMAACRELREETKINIDILDLKYMEELVNEDGSTYILYAYHSPELKIPQLNFEHTESGYFKIEHLESSPTPLCPKVISAIKRYEKTRWKG
jgi:ADP-ribose pyrophosphatase YjhB (NUDIX family)